ncbi:class I SAM-dependent methyltransferase [Myceligenerans crystallogenes]|uniref:Class I SAM-dependent methyltransferase n=1 Tax=Myceligenerans crystallogenes TaxID=316335 RepID=A0ABN2N166_9MICO
MRRAAEVLDRFNARHPWNHNDHFHGWILRRLPFRPAGHHLRVLDVGCGEGELVARLRGRSAVVVGIDDDAGMAQASAARFAGDTGVRIEHLDFMEVTEMFDVVTMVASLHHMPLEDALLRASRLLTPGGRLLVVGLARAGSSREFAVDTVSALANPLMGLAKHPRPVTSRDQEAAPADDPGMPVHDPAETYGEVAATAARVLAGSRFRQRLWFRYTLEWTKPVG